MFYEMLLYRERKFYKFKQAKVDYCPNSGQGGYIFHTVNVNVKFQFSFLKYFFLSNLLKSLFSNK